MRTQFLIEVFVPRTDALRANRLALDAEAVTHRMQWEGTPIRFMRSIFVPDEETCFMLYEAATPDDVVIAAQRAGIGLERKPVSVVEWHVKDATTPAT